MKNKSLRIEGTGGVGLGTNKVGSSVDEAAVYNSFQVGRLDAGFHS